VDEESEFNKLRDLKVFAIERPYSSLLELIGFKYNSNQKVKKLEPITNSKVQNIPITLLSIHHSFETAFARQLNGLDNNQETPRIVLIGLGALGSQTFSNCLRSGYGKWTLIDNDVIWSHNLARHTLGLPSIGKPKALAMADYAKSILEDAEVNAITDGVSTQNKTDMVNALAEADLIIDISTSVAAERAIAVEIESKARRVSFFLTQSGTFLAMLREDAERSTPLDLLEMQFYKILVNNHLYIKYFAYTDTIAYAATCRSITSKIPQDNIALCAAVASKEVKGMPSEPEAKIVVWEITPDGINAARYDAESWTAFHSEEWSVYIDNKLIKEMNTKWQERLPNETGGVLIGQYDYSRNRLYIADMIFSPDDSIESPASYIRGCAGLRERLAAIAELSNGNLEYIGEWHSHPDMDTRMSAADKQLLDTIAYFNKAECKPGCMVIVGAAGNVSVYIKA
jgi:integrative and conjugative element protein (TIGR02256 family)